MVRHTDNTGFPDERANGTVFTVTPSGSETVLHKVTDKQGRFFSQLTLGPKSPSGGLALYGTGFARGAYGYGTIVRVSLSGAVTVLHDFAGGNDGALPLAGLIDVDGTFYGTTYRGRRVFQWHRFQRDAVRHRKRDLRLPRRNAGRVSTHMQAS